MWSAIILEYGLLDIIKNEMILYIAKKLSGEYQSENFFECSILIENLNYQNVKYFLLTL